MDHLLRLASNHGECVQDRADNPASDEHFGDNGTAQPSRILASDSEKLPHLLGQVAHSNTPFADGFRLPVRVPQAERIDFR